MRVIGPTGSALLVVLVLLAGCSAGGGSGFVEGGTTPTVTPAPVPTDERTPVRYPPGLSAGGVDDPYDLASAHGDATNGAYTVAGTRTVRATNGTLLARLDMTVRMAANHSRFQVTIDVTGPETIRLLGSQPAHMEFWSTTDRRILGATTRDGETRYTAFTPRFAPGVGAVGAASYWVYSVMPGGQPWTDIEPLIRALEPRVTGRSGKNGTRVYRIASDRLHDPDVFGRAERADSPANVRFRGLVDGRGMVREYRLDYTARIDSTPVRVTRSLRYTAVGTTTVTRPSWYANAINASRSPHPESSIVGRNH